MSRPEVDRVERMPFAIHAHGEHLEKVAQSLELYYIFFNFTKELLRATTAKMGPLQGRSNGAVLPRNWKGARGKS